MTMPINPNQSWKFLYHDGIDPNGVDCTITSDSDYNLSIDVPHIVKITLTNYNQEKGTIEGRYTLDRSKLSDVVVFKKDSDKKKHPNFNQLIGKPEGFHGTFQWKLWAVKTNEQKCTIL